VFVAFLAGNSLFRQQQSNRQDSNETNEKSGGWKKLGGKGQRKARKYGESLSLIWRDCHARV
jgi:hypothetical protein